MSQRAALVTAMTSSEYLGWGQRKRELSFVVFFIYGFAFFGTGERFKREDLGPSKTRHWRYNRTTIEGY